MREPGRGGRGADASDGPGPVVAAADDPVARAFAGFVRRIRAECDPSRFVLFGSRARGDHLLDSDFDLLVVSKVFESVEPRERVAGILARWPLDLGLDVLCLTPAEFRDEEVRGGSWVAGAAGRGVDLLSTDWPFPLERTMRDETRQWWNLAQADLAAGEELAGSGHHHIAVFLAHQAAEKALKSLWIEREATDPPKTHEIESLARRLGASPEVLSAARNLNPEFVVARYPSAALGSPIDRYSSEGSVERLAEARTVVEWVRAELEGPDGPASV